MRVRIEGHHLPGRHFVSDGEQLDNVHVALQVKADPFEPVPGDSISAIWRFDVTVIRSAGDLDYRGPAVHGRRGERFLYLTWGEVATETFMMFRRAKLMLSDLTSDDLPGDGGTLVARVHLTDDLGGPRCARLRAPVIEWAVSPQPSSEPEPV